jgi:hypothetical protein
MVSLRREKKIQTTTTMTKEKKEKNSSILQIAFFDIFIFSSSSLPSSFLLLISLLSRLPVSPIVRLEHLDQLIISTKNLSSGQKVSVETLLDCLIVLFDECQNSSLRREKTVSEFIELSEYLASLFLLE